MTAASVAATKSAPVDRRKKTEPRHREPTDAGAENADSEVADGAEAVAFS
jgi:hypothetical protein